MLGQGDERFAVGPVGAFIVEHFTSLSADGRTMNGSGNYQIIIAPELCGGLDLSRPSAQSPFKSIRAI